ncbi:MAG: YfcE family phosphodiesterase [Gemmatimonadaceae bacterium]
MEKRLMLVGLLADTHCRVPAIRAIIALMAERGVHLVLHAGDYCAPFALLPFQEASMALAGVFGRNDGDREGLRAVAQQSMGIELYESPHSLELAGQRILIVHDIQDVGTRSIEGHAIVLHGQTHREEMKTRGDSLIVNPGEGCGWLHGAPSAAILDLETKHLDFFKLPND